MMDYLNISGKTAIVTGGSRGIGKSIAEELAQFGVAVVLADVKKEEGQDVEKSIIYAGGKAKYIYYIGVNMIREELNKLFNGKVCLILLFSCAQKLIKSSV